MGRGGLIAAGALVTVAAVIVAGWFFLLRDTAEPVTVDEAVTSFRTDTEPTPDAPSPIADGVYVYATSGYEQTDALTGVVHRYPLRSTITVTAADCGVSLVWRVLKGRTTEWTYCVTANGWELRSQDERHTFFGRTEQTTYTCDNTPIRPAAPHVGMSWRVRCTTDGAEETGVGRVVGRQRSTLAGGPRITLLHVRKATRFSGEIRGTARHEIWFDLRSGVPVRIVMVSRTTNDSPVGDVHYDEEVSLRLTSLTPRR